MRAIIFAAIGSFMITLGQVLWKIAIDKNGGLINNTIALSQNFMNIFSSPYMISGIIIYMFATVFWMYLLGKYEYSFIYPLFSMTYIFSFLFAFLLFGENISISKLIGICFIMLGIVFISGIFQ